MDFDWLCDLDDAVEELADGTSNALTLEPTTRLRAYPVDTREGFVVGVQVVSDARLGHWLVVLQVGAARLCPRCACCTCQPHATRGRAAWARQQSSAGTVFRKHKVHTDELLQAAAAEDEAELGKLHDTLSHFEELIKNVNAGWLLRSGRGGQPPLLAGDDAAHAMPTATVPAPDEVLHLRLCRVIDTTPCPQRRSPCCSPCAPAA